MKRTAQSKATPSTSSFTPVPTNLVQRKCACGESKAASAECEACKKKKQLGEETPLVQPKLKISQPNDKYEQEADRVADEVMRMPSPMVQRQAGIDETEDEETIQTKPIASKITPIAQRQAADAQEEEEEMSVQTKTARDRNFETTHAISPGIKSMQHGGRPLSRLERRFFESRFGADFSNIRVHRNPQTANIARSINARAFTIENNIFLGGREEQQNSFSGMKLLAHELTHTIQQGFTPEVQRRFDASTTHKSSSVDPKRFTNKNLAGRNFRRKDLQRANFSGSDLTGAKFNWSNLEEANFNGANLTKAKFVNTKLTRATFREANMEKTKLLWADLFAADLGKARLFRSNLKGANLLAANLRGANMIGAKLRGADFSGATLTTRELLGADTRGAVGLFTANQQLDAEDLIHSKKQLLSTLAGAWVGKIDGAEGKILFTLRGSVGDMIGTFRSRRDPRVFHLLVKAAPQGSRRHDLRWNDGFGGRGEGWIERTIEGTSIRGSIYLRRGSNLGNDITLIRTTDSERKIQT